MTEDLEAPAWAAPHDLFAGDVISRHQDDAQRWKVVRPGRHDPVRRRPIRSDSSVYVVPAVEAAGALPTPWPWRIAFRWERGPRTRT